MQRESRIYRRVTVLVRVPLLGTGIVFDLDHSGAALSSSPAAACHLGSLAARPLLAASFSVFIGSRRSYDSQQGSLTGAPLLATRSFLMGTCQCFLKTARLSREPLSQATLSFTSVLHVVRRVHRRLRWELGLLGHV